MAPTQLQIKVNALKRLIKEETLYQKEVKEQEQHVATMKKDNADEYEIKKQIEVLEESQRMVPEITAKINQHKSALAKFLETYNGDEDLSAAEELLK